MSDPLAAPGPLVVVTGANGLVGSRVCAALLERGARVRAVVRQPGAALGQEGVEEAVGEFTDPAFAAEIVTGADAVVTTVHPMDADEETQRRIGVDGTVALARAATDAGVPMLVHVSTCAVYDRSPGVGDIDEAGSLEPDDARMYGVVKRDVDAALAALDDGLTRVLVRPPAILGDGETSVWNTLRPTGLRDEPRHRHAVADASWPWVHLDDLAALLADVAAGRVAPSDDPDVGPVPGSTTVVNCAGEPATWRDYLGTVTDALGVDPVWESGEVWTGVIRTDRARAWGWTPQVGLADALAEVHASAARLRDA